MPQMPTRQSDFYRGNEGLSSPSLAAEIRPLSAFTCIDVFFTAAKNPPRAPHCRFVRHSIEPRLRELSGDSIAVRAIALDAGWAVFCYLSTTPGGFDASRRPVMDD